MGVEVVAFEMAKVAEVDNGLKENGKLADQPIKFGSQGDEPVKGKVAVAVDDNIPKNAAFEWPMAKAVHSFYFVRYRPYADPKIRAKIDQADKEIQKKNQARSPLTDELRAKKSERAEIFNQLKSLHAEGKQYKMILDEKKKEMAPLQNALGKLRDTRNDSKNSGGICSSEQELNNLIRSLQYHMQHETITLPEEKQILREIKQLEGTREKVIANAGMRAKIQDSLGQKDVIQDQVKLMGTDLDGIRKENDNVWNKIKKLEEKLKVVEREINALQEELTALFQKRDKAFGTIHELRKQQDEENTFFKQSREVLAQAKLLAVADVEKRKEAIVELEQLSTKEVDNFISLYSKDKSFREDYQRRILSSLDMRQFSKDGRIRNPDEKPILAVEAAAPSEPEMVSKAPVKHPKEEPKSAPKEDTLHLLSQKDGSKKESKSKLGRVDDADEETFVVEKARKDAAKEKEIDEAKLKEMKREEEMAKAKQAMERKKKLADKAAAKAALRAQKEAQKMLKDREKKAKKKAAASQVEDPAEPSADAPEPEEVEENEEPSALPVKQQKVHRESKVRSRNRTRGPESIPKSILKRKKSTNYYWMMAVPAGLAVLILLVLAYYYRFL